MDSTPRNDPPIINITGEKVALGPQRRDLVPLYLKWLNDFAVMAPTGTPLYPITEEAEVTQYESTSTGEHQAWFTVYELSVFRPIGIAGLRDIDHTQGTAEFVIFLGERDDWGKGFGTETTRLTLDYGFVALGLHNIMLKVYSFNKRGYRAYLRAGFKEIGRRRQAHRIAGKVHHVIYMDCLATEFESPVLRRLLEGQ
jgi:RimJ/RimL family protein N-acetyltransferase